MNFILDVGNSTINLNSTIGDGNISNAIIDHSGSNIICAATATSATKEENEGGNGSKYKLMHDGYFSIERTMARRQFNITVSTIVAKIPCVPPISRN